MNKLRKVIITEPDKTFRQMISTDINTLFNPQGIAAIYVASIIVFVILMVIYHTIWGNRKVNRWMMSEKVEKEAVTTIWEIVRAFQEQNKEINKLREQTYEGYLSQELHQAKQEAARKQNRLYPLHD